MENKNLAFNKKQTARILGASPNSVGDSRWRKRVGLPATRIGRSLRFLDRDIQELLKRGRESLGGKTKKNSKEHHILVIHE